MVLLRETTKWDASAPALINHVYILDKPTSNKILGYIREGAVEAIKFSKPLMFNRKGRSFAPAKEKDFDMSAFKEN